MGREGQGLCPQREGGDEQNALEGRKNMSPIANVTQSLGRSEVTPHLPPRLPHFHRVWVSPQGAVSADSLAELEGGALLLQTLQLSRISFPIGQRLLGSKRKMSLNPIAKQIPHVVEACCSFIEKHGKGPRMEVKSRWKAIKETRILEMGKGNRSREEGLATLPSHQLGLECGGGGKG